MNKQCLPIVTSHQQCVDTDTNLTHGCHLILLIIILGPNYRLLKKNIQDGDHHFQLDKNVWF